MKLVIRFKQKSVGVVFVGVVFPQTNLHFVTVCVQNSVCKSTGKRIKRHIYFVNAPNGQA
ncbi:MAG: hypothetical protein M3367_09975 [Acidobacteriota bacterium]|nr:hypothetical protein [Acidobacteriota bacterium]